MENRISINGIDFTGFVEGVDDLVLTYSLDDSTKTVDVAISSGLTFRGPAFDYLEPLFFGNFDARNATADIQIYSACCGNTFDLKIRADAVEICFETCEISTSSFEETPDFIAAKKLQEIPIFANQYINPKLPVCINYGFFGTAFGRALFVISDAFASIATVLTWFGFPQVEAALNEVKELALGCNAFVNAFHIRTILEDGTDLVGLSFSSSIFESGTYANAVWIDPSSPVTGGGYFRFAVCEPLNQLVGTITYTEFLDILSDLFNADYRIKNGVLTFERKDFFFDNESQIVNVEEKYRNDERGSLPCYSYTDEIKYAAGRFNYTKDDAETAGNKTWFERYRLNISFNEPFNPTLKGLKEVIIPVAPASFTQDGFQISTFDGDRPPGVMVMENAGLEERDLPKILIIKPQTAGDPDFCQAQVVGSVANQDFNYPMWLRIDAETPGELYDNFHSICDTRITPIFLYQLDEFEYLANCAEKQRIINNRLDVHAFTRLGKGFPQEIDVDINSGKITLKDVKILQ